MNTRLDLLATVPKGGVAAELGVFEGSYSDEIIRICQPSSLFLVDLWDGWQTSGGAGNPGEVDHTVFLPQEKARLQARGNVGGTRVYVVQAASWDWLRSLPTASLDFVYIDTFHGYSGTLTELEESRRPVKLGGIIAGHDYDPRTGVIKAVVEFCAKYNLPVTVWDGDKVPSFSIVNR